VAPGLTLKDLNTQVCEQGNKRLEVLRPQVRRCADVACLPSCQTQPSLSPWSDFVAASHLRL
jgi:hypothetical protein